jgi:hypothetical protein
MRCNASCRIRNCSESRPPIGCTYVSDESCALSLQWSNAAVSGRGRRRRDAAHALRAHHRRSVRRVASRRIASHPPLSSSTPKPTEALADGTAVAARGWPGRTRRPPVRSAAQRSARLRQRACSTAARRCTASAGLLRFDEDWMGCSLQEGTPVWHSTRGLGRIVSVTAGVVTPVVVRFSSGEARRAACLRVHMHRRLCGGPAEYSLDGRTALRRTAPRRTAPRCAALRCTALHCAALRCAALPRPTLQRAGVHPSRTAEPGLCGGRRCGRPVPPHPADSCASL